MIKKIRNIVRTFGEKSIRQIVNKYPFLERYQTYIRDSRNIAEYQSDDLSRNLIAITTCEQIFFFITENGNLIHSESIVNDNTYKLYYSYSSMFICLKCYFDYYKHNCEIIGVIKTFNTTKPIKLESQFKILYLKARLLKLIGNG